MTGSPETCPPSCEPPTLAPCLPRSPLQAKLDRLFDKGYLRKSEIDTVLLEDIESERRCCCWWCWVLPLDSRRWTAAAGLLHHAAALGLKRPN